MALKNYTTTVSVESTVSEIERILVRAGASKVMKDYEGGQPVAVSFMLLIDGMELPFQLPVRAENVLKVLERQYTAKMLSKKFSAKMLTKEIATRVGWRILKDWVDAQMALIQIGMAKIEEVFCLTCIPWPRRKPSTKSPRKKECKVSSRPLRPPMSGERWEGGKRLVLYAPYAITGALAFIILAPLMPITIVFRQPKWLEKFAEAVIYVPEAIYQKMKRMKRPPRGRA